jgi:hypothetical protein
MKFTVNVTGEAALGLPEQDFEIDAKDGDAAVNAARKRLEKLAPQEGGALDIVVTANEEWLRITTTQRGGEIRETVPPGEVSRFGICLEPHESVRAEVEARRAAEEATAIKASERKAIELELIARLKAEGHLAADVEVSK